MVEHFHGKEGVSGSNPEDGSIFILRIMSRICIKNLERGLRLVLKDSDAQNPLFFIGLNPSLADDKRVDPTWYRMQKIAQNNGFDGIIAINLSPEITPYPKELHLEQEIFFELNLQAIQQEIALYLTDHASLLHVWCGWGANVGDKPYQRLAMSAQQILSLFPEGTHFYALPKLTKNGNPRHPLYAKINSKLVKFSNR